MQCAIHQDLRVNSISAVTSVLGSGWSVKGVGGGITVCVSASLLKMPCLLTFCVVIVQLWDSIDVAIVLNIKNICVQVVNSSLLMSGHSPRIHPSKTVMGVWHLCA